MVMKLVFPERVKYCQNEGYRTAGIALPFRVLEGLNTRNGDMVDPTGAESNRLFEVLREWEHHLAPFDLSDLRCGDEHLK